MINRIDDADETAFLIATITGKFKMDIWINTNVGSIKSEAQYVQAKC